LKRKVFFLLFFFPLALCAQFDIDHYKREGLQCIRDSRYNQAIARFTTIAHAKDNQWDIYFLRGAAKFYLGDYYGAIKDFDTGLGINPYFSELYLFRGISFQLLNDYSTAKQNYQKAMELDPANPSVYSNLGLIDLLNEQYQSADHYFSQAIDIKPNYGDAYLYRALCKSEQMDSIHAFGDFDKALKYNRFDERVYMWRGKLFAEMGHYPSAIQDFNKAISFNEQNPLLYYYRAIIRYDMEDIDGCLADFDKVLSLNPGNELVYYNRALVRTEVGLFDKAWEDYAKVIELNPKNLLGHFNRGMLSLDNKYYPGALQDFSSAIKIHPDFYWAYLARAEAKAQMNDIPGANADRLAANNIKANNGGSEYGDTATFKKLIKFDAEFTEDSEGKMLSLKKMMKGESKSLYAHDFMLGIQPVSDSTFSYYYFPFLEEFNEKNALDEISFRMIQKADSSYWHTLSVTSGQPDTLYQDRQIRLFVQGITDALQNNYNSASNKFSELVATDASFIPAVFNRAYTKAAVVDMLRSFDDMQQEISVISKSEELNKRAMPKQRKVYHDYYSVIDDYRAVLSVSPDFYFAHYNLGNVNAKMYNYHQALSEYTLALDTNPEFAEAYYNRGLTYLYLSDTTSACADFSKAGQFGFSDVYPVIRKSCGKN